MEKRINLYIENGIWYDTSADLIKVHEFPKAWLDLLKAMGLEQLAQKPIAGSVVQSENR